MSFHTIGPGLPQLEVSVDFTNDPTNATRVWTDVTTDVRAIGYTRTGRSDALQSTATGSLTATLANVTGNYDPTNAAGAYYPGVRRERWIRVRAQWSGVIYNRFQGLIDAWNPSWPGSGKDSTVDISATAALKVLSLFDLGGRDYPAERTDQRVTAVCGDVGIVSSVTTGISSIVDSGTISTGTSALSHLQDVENTENGRLFDDAGGTIVFQDRHYRLTHSSTSQGTIGDAAGQIRYRDTSLAYDDANIWNQANVTPSGGTVQTASDATSQAHYYTRTIERSILSADPIEALSAAQYLVKIYKEPSPKLPVLTLLGLRDTTTWPKILAAANSQRFSFRRRPRYGGTITLDGFVEQVADAIVPGQAWDVSLQLAPTDDQAFWVLGDASFGLLGISTVLGY